MNLFENLQVMKESEYNDYNGESYWSKDDLDKLMSMLANKINTIDISERQKLKKEFSKYNREMPFMPKYTIGLNKKEYPSDIDELIPNPEPTTFLDEDELWDCIEDLINLNKYLDKII